MDLRQYDPAIGRWVVQDPIVHHDFSPYSAFDNNPVYWSDPSGANSVRYNWDTGNYDVFGKNDDLLGSFDAEQFGNYLNNPEAFAAKFYEFSDFDENNGNGGGGGNGNEGPGPRKKIAIGLINIYKNNSNLQMAYSLIMNTLFETTEIGDLTRQAREEFIKTYGTVNAQKYSDVYGHMIDILKEIKDQNKGSKYLSDAYIYKISALFGLKATGIAIENEILEMQIKNLDINLYYYHINPSAAPKGGGFSGGGAGGQWY